jgi:hypothetical protein
MVFSVVGIATTSSLWAGVAPTVYKTVPSGGWKSISIAADWKALAETVVVRFLVNA